MPMFHAASQERVSPMPQDHAAHEGPHPLATIDVANMVHVLQRYGSSLDTHDVEAMRSALAHGPYITAEVSHDYVIRMQIGPHTVASAVFTPRDAHEDRPVHVAFQSSTQTFLVQRATGEQIALPCTIEQR